tara:strand:+ start:19583 stop:19897 length:315 start_codon:yes stop_codon:yes gene_type:complete
MNFGVQRPLYIVAKCKDASVAKIITAGNQNFFFVYGENAEGYPYINETPPTSSNEYFECVVDSTLNINTAKHVTVQIKGMVPNTFKTMRKAYSCLGDTYPLQSF